MNIDLMQKKKCFNFYTIAIAIMEFIFNVSFNYVPSKIISIKNFCHDVTLMLQFTFIFKLIFEVPIVIQKFLLQKFSPAS